MVFNSLNYFLFLSIVYLLFSLTKDRYRWFVLLLSSYFFYGFILKPILLIALTVVILVTFRIGWLIDRSEEQSKRRLFLWIGVILNISLLVYFKYLSFLSQNLNLIFSSVNIPFYFDNPSPLVSIGLSFYIFQAISYLADIYFRMAKHEPHLGFFALYLAFFPKLLQGPIERAGDLLPQLKAKYEFNYDNIRFGMLLFIWGLFKKVVIADRLGLYVDVVYNDIHASNGLSLLFATYVYAFQILMDFSGYTDMALGSARLFNINLTQNFNAPYLATSVADFWRRWHISFSRWILDYIFEPLQMSFRNFAKWGIAASLLITFILAGVWHGANWTFVAFGLIHGIYLAASFFYKPYQKKLHKALGIQKSRFLKVWQIFVTFNLVSFAWVFFRAGSFHDALSILDKILKLNGPLYIDDGFHVLQGMLPLAVLLLIETRRKFKKTGQHVHSQASWFKGQLTCAALIIAIILLGVFDDSQFIYFKF